MARLDAVGSWDRLLRELVDRSVHPTKPGEGVAKAIGFALELGLRHIGARRGGWRGARGIRAFVTYDVSNSLARRPTEYGARAEHEVDWTPTHSLRAGEVRRQSARQLRSADDGGHEWLFCRSDRSVRAGLLWLEFAAPGRATDAQARSLANSLASVTELSERLQPDETRRRLGALARHAGAWIHDINHIIQLVSLNAEALDEGMDGPAERALETLIANVRDARSLCERALKDGRRFSSRAPILLGRLLQRESAAAATLSGRSQRVHVLMDCPDDLTVNAEDSTLSRVVRNLVLNAIEASHDGGEVSVRARAVAGDFCELRIEDRGRGMAFEEQQCLMRCGQSGGAGTGFGTSSAADCIADLDGSMEIESRVGIGTVVRIVIPRDAGANDARRVIVVGRDARRRTRAANAFHQKGWRVLEAADAWHTAELLAERGPADVVVCRGTPGEDWRRVTDALRRFDGKLAVLSITSGSIDRSVERATEQLVLAASDSMHRTPASDSRSLGRLVGSFER